MAIYRVPVTIKSPSADTEGKYLAEVPALPGCRAWGDTMDDALSYIQSVTAAFIDTYRDRGEPLPPGLTALTDEQRESLIEGELLISA